MESGHFHGSTVPYGVWYPGAILGEVNADLATIPPGNSLPPQGQTPGPENNKLQHSGSIAGTTRTSVPVACVACRSRHLKCDGGTVCSRCRAEGVTCSYVKSRRGWKGPRRKLFTSAQGRQDSLSNHQGALQPAAVSLPPFSLDTALVNTVKGESPGTDSSASPPQTSLTVTTMPTKAQVEGLGPSGTIAAYYFFFDSAHPFLLPRSHLLKRLKEGYHPQLELAMKFVGSCYIPSAPTETMRDDLSHVLFRTLPPKDGFTVQALMIFAVALHSQYESQLAMESLYTAISLALEIGMHRAEFAPQNADNRVMEESWRRTWWALYIINGSFAAVNPVIEFKLRSVVTDVPLPCEEQEYLSGRIPLPRTLQDYDDAAFTEYDEVFSSFTYLIDAVRILGRVLASNEGDSTELQSIELTDTSLMNWSLHLPDSKRADLVGHNGNYDEILFQAHLIINAGAIMLHRPRSTLGCTELQQVTKCSPPALTLYPRQGDPNIHTAKAVQAAEEVSRLMGFPVPLQRHSCFFTCVVVMASVVHLAYWSWIVPDGEDAAVKELIKMDTGVLKNLAESSKLAKAALGEVRRVAQEMLTSKRTLSNHVWSTIAGEEIFRGIVEENGELVNLSSQFLNP